MSVDGADMDGIELIGDMRCYHKTTLGVPAPCAECAVRFRDFGCVAVPYAKNYYTEADGKHVMGHEGKWHLRKADEHSVSCEALVVKQKRRGKK